MKEEQEVSTTTNTLKNIGTILRQKREESSYTLTQVAEITRITKTNLRHIEDGNIEELPGLVFVRGFLRNYAKLLGLDSDWMVEELNMIYIQQGSGSIPEGSVLPEEKDWSPNQERSNPYVPILVIVVLLSVVASGLVYYFFWQPKRSVETTGEIIESVAPPESVETKLSEPVSSELTITEETLNNISPLSIRLKGNQRGWVRIVIDNEKPFDFEIRSGETYEWPAQETIELIMTTGNTANIFLNNESVEIPEEQANQLYTRIFDTNTLTQLNY